MRLQFLLIGCAAVVAIGTYSALDARSQPLLAPARPVLFVDGKPRTDVTADLQQLSWDDRTGKLEFTLNNWSAPNLKYSEGSVFRIGTTVAYYAGYGTNSSRKVSEGRVVEIAPHFNPTVPPTITIRVAGAAQAASSPASPLAIGREIDEFHPVEKSDGSVSCSGVARDRSDLSKGVTVRISGAGARFSGDYALNSTVYTFDSTKGNRVEFTCTWAGAARRLP